MNVIKPSPKDKLLTAGTAAKINKMHTPKTSIVLRKLLLNNTLRPYDLSKALGILHQTIHQLLHKDDLYPKISTLLPIAQYFKITISQLIGEGPLDREKPTESDKDEPGIWNYELFSQCTTLVAQLFEKYKIVPNPKFAVQLISDIYQYSLRGAELQLDKNFADWYVSKHTNKQ